MPQNSCVSKTIYFLKTIVNNINGIFFWDQIINGTKRNDKFFSYKIITKWTCV